MSIDPDTDLSNLETAAAVSFCALPRTRDCLLILASHCRQVRDTCSQFGSSPNAWGLGRLADLLGYGKGL